MEKLNLPGFSPVIRPGKGGKEEIFDPFRRRFVRLTPEEWVRQHFLHYMTDHLGFPASLIIVEASLKFNTMLKRFDILACLPDGRPCMVVECKSPAVGITQAVFDQVAMYNLTLAVGCLVVTNGLSHYACQIDHENQRYSFLPEIPDFNTLG
jgi:hypothetical protein